MARPRQRASQNLIVNAPELTALLRRSEGETLDFKSKQYPFAGASDVDKSELLKDILSIANAWKTSDGYILIGVEEVNQRATVICGADATLPDNDVQQFVNSKTNRPISFRVGIFPFLGVMLTVIHIDKGQRRPFYLNKNFGLLKSQVVYIRRGSSTDEAEPDEIAEMGKEAIQVANPDVSLEFEFVVEARKVWPMFSRYPPEPPKVTETSFIKIYAVNHKGGLAQHLQGSALIPKPILYASVRNDQTLFARGPEDVAKADLELIEVSNEILDKPTVGWRALSPGGRLCLKKLILFPYRFEPTALPGSILWRLSVNGGDLIEGETRFADIPLIGQRSK